MEEKAAENQSSLEELHSMVKEVGELKQIMKEVCTPGINITISPYKNEGEGHEEEVTDDSQKRGQWLRAAVLGANDGLVTTASLMMGVGAVKTDSKTMVMSGLAALVAGACSMAIGEFVSVQTQRDVEISYLKTKKAAKAQAPMESPRFELSTSRSSSFSGSSEKFRKALSPKSVISGSEKEKEGLPNPIQAACASALAFTVGALMPLLSAAFINDYVWRVVMIAGVSSVILLLFGAVGAYFASGSMVKGSLRVLVGGWAAMLTTYGILKLFHHTEAGDDM